MEAEQMIFTSADELDKAIKTISDKLAPQATGKK